MKIYVLSSVELVEYQGERFRVIGAYDSRAAAEKAGLEYINSKKGFSMYSGMDYEIEEVILNQNP